MDTYKFVKAWRHRTKEKLVDAFGGKCICCGYKNFRGALEFHHLDPKNKDFSIGSVSIKSWKVLVDEVLKCVLICRNCHTEIHGGVRKLPNQIPSIDKDLLQEERIIKKNLKDNCPVCGEIKWKFSKTCSNKCFARLRSKIDWDNLNLEEMLKTKTYAEIGREIGCMGNIVKKHSLRRGLKSYRSHN